AAHSHLTATAVSVGAIALAWIDNASDEAGFEIERSPDGVAFAPLTALAANTTSFSDTGLSAGTHYYYRVRATNDAGNSGYANTADAIARGAATHFVLSTPQSSTAGSAQNVTVTALDAFNNTAPGYGGTIHFMSSDATALLPGDYPFVSTDNGTHTFSVTFKTAGAQSLTATDTVSASVTGTQSGITVNPAAASTLSVTAFPSPVTAGTAGGFTVSARDAYGNVASGYAGTVHFSSSDSQAVLPADATLSNGTAAFSAALKTAGSQSLTARDTLANSLSGTQSGITVNPAAASNLSVTAFPSPVTAGTAGGFTVSARDAYGNVATGYAGTVHFSSSDVQAVLP